MRLEAGSLQRQPEQHLQATDQGMRGIKPRIGFPSFCSHHWHAGLALHYWREVPVILSIQDNTQSSLPLWLFINKKPCLQHALNSSLAGKQDSAVAQVSARRQNAWGLNPDSYLLAV